MKSVIVCAVLVGVGFYQHLQNYKLKLELKRYKELYQLSNSINKQKAELFADMHTKYKSWESKYKYLREQNYILTRKFRKTDTKEYRKYLAKLVRDASGIGGDKMTECKKHLKIFSWPKNVEKRNSISRVMRRNMESCTTSFSTHQPTQMQVQSM